MCFVCSRLGLSDGDEDWTPGQDQDDEEESEVPQPQLPHRRLASRAPREETVVEPAPSHENTPTFAAYSVIEGTQPADRTKQRPAYCLCIYDVTPDANPARAEQMARAIFERTMAHRRRPDNDRDRVEVVALPRPEVREQSDIADRELAEHCARHFEKERASRLVIGDAALAKSWYLPEMLSDQWYSMGILVISRVTDRWEEGLDWIDKHPEDFVAVINRQQAYNSRFGTCLLVKWQPREWIWRAYEEPITSESRLDVSTYSLEALRSAASELIASGVRKFYEHFLQDGILDRELTAAR